MIKAITHFFDKLEDKVRGRLSHRSIIYAFIGGTFTIIFWRGIWHTADILDAKGGVWHYIFYEPNTIVWSVALLLLTGLFVSIMIGDRIIISGLKNEKKVEEKTEEEVMREGGELNQITFKINLLQKEIQEMKEMIREKN